MLTVKYYPADQNIGQEVTHMTTQTSPTRPTCGTCPHKLVGQRKAENYCYALPSVDAKPVPIDDISPGCIHHPDMAAYIASWKRGKKNP